MSNYLMIGERPNKANIESLDFKRKVKLLSLWCGNIFVTTKYISFVLEYILHSHAIPIN